MSTTTPAVYVGTWHKYNCGSIFEKWFDLTDLTEKRIFSNPDMPCIQTSTIRNSCSKTGKATRPVERDSGVAS